MCNRYQRMTVADGANANGCIFYDKCWPVIKLCSFINVMNFTVSDYINIAKNTNVGR